MNLTQTTILTEIMQTREVRRIEEDAVACADHDEFYDYAIL